MEDGSEAFFLPEHYRPYPVVLMRLDRARPELFEGLPESAWRRHTSIAARGVARSRGG